MPFVLCVIQYPDWKKNHWKRFKRNVTELSEWFRVNCELIQTILLNRLTNELKRTDSRKPEIIYYTKQLTEKRATRLSWAAKMYSRVDLLYFHLQTKIYQGKNKVLSTGFYTGSTVNNHFFWQHSLGHICLIKPWLWLALWKWIYECFVLIITIAEVRVSLQAFLRIRLCTM